MKTKDGTTQLYSYLKLKGRDQKCYMFVEIAAIIPTMEIIGQDTAPTTGAIIILQKALAAALMREPKMSGIAARAVF